MEVENTELQMVGFENSIIGADKGVFAVLHHMELRSLNLEILTIVLDRVDIVQKVHL